ncbi:two pore channel protein 2 isoform X2 [Tachysurus fulvidraco]|uniref:two pore channel protein 2 isoform X2 n=1 Tax=Tachysurus fulvidraco TaxID=1234273 RepID=UPI000F4F018F|nr:two pore channel protein 2 isoform X2 [Tachysurus fulvidraco]
MSGKQSPGQKGDRETLQVCPEETSDTLFTNRMETEPLLTEHRKRDSVDYGSQHDSHSDSQSDSKEASRLSNSHSRDSVHVQDRDEDLYIQQAVVFIEDAIQYRSINHKVDLRSLNLYRWYYSRICQWGLGFTIAIILALAFVEKPSSITYTSDPRFRPEPWEPPCGLPEAIEMVCLCIFILDIVVKSYLIGWEEFRANKWLIGYALVIAVSVIDCIISFAMLCDPTIRVRRLIRPFFLLQNSSLMKKTLKCIKRTIPEIVSVFLLLALHLCLFTMIGMLIFPRSEDSSKNGEWELYFRNLPKALSSLLVLLTTANNPDVMIPAYSLNRGYTIFFILFSVCGTYILMNLLTAIIYNQFRGYLLMSVQASILRRLLGIRAAFRVLCCPGQRHDDSSEDLKRVRVGTVLQVMRKVQMTSYYRQAVIKAAQEFPDGFIDGEAFQRLFDELDKEHIKEHPPNPQYSSSILQSVQKVCSHYYLTVVGNVVALTNVICICTILVLDSEKTVIERNDYYMEVINWAFIIYYLIEMILKLIALGWKGYISYRNNVFDGFFTILLLILQVTIFVVFRITDPKSMMGQLGGISLWEMVRLVNMLIVFRFLRIIPEIKLMALVASTLVDLVKNLRAFAGILLVVYYVYAVIGIWLFQGAITPPVSSVANSSSENSTSNFTMECGSYEQLEYWPNNFDDFASSLVLLYDVMVVNNWHVFMDAYTRYTTEWSKVYFVSWWFTSSVMWVNLFVALILENFTYKWDKSHAMSVSDVERTSYETTVHVMFRDKIQEPSLEDLEKQLQCIPHLHFPRWSLQSHSP